MIDLDMNPADAEIVALARAQAAVHLAHAPHIDHTMDFTRENYGEQLAPPDAGKLVHLRELARRRADDLSGLVIIEPLILIEESYGLKPLYWQGAGADMMNISVSGLLLERIGTPEQIARWGDKYLAWGMTEPGGGSDPASMKTRAVYDAATDRWVINGEKTFSSNATQADGILVMCRTTGPQGDEGISLFIVDKGMPGYEIGPQMDKLGLRNWDTVATSFMDVRVEPERRLQGNLKDALSIFNGTRALIAAQGLGFARIALDQVGDMLAARGDAPDYGGTLADRSAVEDRLLRLEALYDATYLTMLHAKWREQAHGPDKFYPAVAKCKAGLAVRRLISECMDILGPESTTALHRVEQAFRDARILDIYEGPSETQRLIIGRQLLGLSASELN